MTCKDCIGFERCKQLADEGVIYLFSGLDGAEENDCFKDKSRFVELPFAIGQTVYRVVCDCANCGYCATESCYAKNECLCKYKVKEMKYDLYVFDSKIECFETRDEAEKALKEREKNDYS